MPLYVADYLADTTHLSTLEHGAYCLLLMSMWRNGGTLPDDDAKLAKFARMTGAQWARVRGSVMAFFDVEEGVCTQRRLAVEIEKHANVVRQRRESGSLGGKAKALKDNKPTLALARDLLCQPEPEPELKEESPPPPKGEKKARRKPETPLPDDFPTLEMKQDAVRRVAAAQKGVRVSAEAERCRNWCLQEDKRCRDWAAFWRNWIDRAIERAPALGLVVSTPDPEHDPWPHRLRLWRGGDWWNDVDWGPEPGKPGCRVPPHHLKLEAAE
jgi:uncharacterized protein YdaU (DUF1376 family)